jgi:multidrug efflux pump
MPKNMSLSQAKEYLDEVTKEVPNGVAVAYEGNLAAQAKSNKTFSLLFIAGLIFIFAVLAIQFESILDPLIILVTVPLAGIGGVFLLWILGLGTNLYTQIGMLSLIGLISKPGILLVEFVRQQRLLGSNLREAVLLAARLRFRPIIMTTAATVLGAVPLILNTGAGSEARVAIGTVIVGGMILGTLLSLFVLPLSIYSIYKLIKAQS